MKDLIGVFRYPVGNGMTSALCDKTIRPTDEDITKVLADSRPLWDSLREHVASAYGKYGEEWKFYGAKAGWILAVFSGKRRLANMIPMNGHFMVGFTLSEKAADAARSSSSDVVRSVVSDEKLCVCGYEAMIEIHTSEDTEAAKQLLEIKGKS